MIQLRFSTLLGTLALLGLAAGCGSSNGGNGALTGGGGHGGGAGAVGAAGGAAGGASGAVGGAGGAVAGGGGAGGAITGGGGATGLGGGSAGAAGGAPAAGGAAGASVASGGAGGGVTGQGGTAAGGTTASSGGAGGASLGAGGTGGTASGTPAKVAIVIASESTVKADYGLGQGVTTTMAGEGAATFTQTTSPSTNNCPGTTVGPCQVYLNCMASSATTTVLDGGTVTISGLTGGPLTLARISASAGYYSISSYLWTTPTLATVTVGGTADVPAYTMSVTTPSPITLTAPTSTTYNAAGPIFSVSRTADLVVTWTGGTNGQVSVDLESTSPAAEAACTADASAGTLTIPASILANFGGTTGMGVGVTTVTTKNTGDWLMEFEAQQTPISGSTITFTN